MKYKLLFGFIFFLVCCTKQNLFRDTNKVIRLQKLAEKSNGDSIFYYVKKAQNILNKTNKIADTLIIENLFLTGNYYKQKNILDSARHFFHQTLALAKKNKNRKKNIKYFRSAWEMEELQDNIGNAISIAKEYINIPGSNKKEFVGDLVYVYNYLERANLDLGNYKESLYYNAKTLKAAEESLDNDMYIITASSKASTFYDLEKKGEAFKLLDSISTIKCGIDGKRQLNRAYGTLYFYEGKFPKAIEYFEKVIVLTKKYRKLKETKNTKLDHNYNFIEAYNNISEAYLYNKNYSQAKSYLDTSKTLIHSNSYQPLVDFYDSLRFLLSYRTGENENDVLHEYKTLINNNKKRLQERIDEKLYALTIATEKERIATNLKNQSELDKIKLISLLVFFALLMLVGVLLYRQRNLNFKKQEIQMQQRLLRSQMNSHFTFNTLSVIQNQIRDNQEAATAYLLKFSRLLRLILNNSLYNYVQIENELESLQKYLDLQLIRFQNKFDYKITLDNFEIDDLLYIPPMLIQPFIENSIEHGFSQIDYKGHISVNLKLLNNKKHIHCIIEDNGIGLNNKNNTSAFKKSISTDLIFKFIHKATKQKISIVDKINQKESGVIIKFLIPYKHSEND
ncbi:histidine kinase [Tenacibaculum aiptasiae]|uniref:histidine kinase n=1 Tax=Tenacibaculum aiptasiae TaxID=426481 RepID=UPI00232F2966|nr:histidine kinase [Tenacibaculum aiptasiae]